MNKHFFVYKLRFLTVALLLGYTFLHIKLTGVYVGTPLGELSIRLPFGQRLLIPAIAHFIAPWLHLNADEIFFLVEWLSVSLLYLALYYVLRIEFVEKEAKVLSWLFILLLPLVTIINYRYAATGSAAIYFPGDSATAFFIAAGFFFSLQSRWYLFTLTVFLATLNRESSIILVFLIPALYWGNLKTVLAPWVAAAIAFVIARLLVIYWVHNLPGEYFELYFFNTEYTRFEVNLWRLLQGMQLFYFIFCLAALPLFWFAFYDYIPRRYRPIRYLGVFYFLALLLVGNFIEARIFSEIVVLLYLPVCLALKNWLNHHKPELDSSKEGVLFYINRYAILALLTLCVLFKEPINHGVIWVSHLF